MLNQNSLLQDHTPSFPIQLDQRKFFDYYFLRDKLSAYFETAVDEFDRINLKQEFIKKGKFRIGG